MAAGRTHQSLGHVASNTHNGLVHFNGLDIVIVGIYGQSVSCLARAFDDATHKERCLVRPNLPG